MDDISDCRQCLGGYYCHMQGAINFDFSKNDTGTGICAAGYYCKSGKIIHFQMGFFDIYFYVFLFPVCKLL